MVHKFLNRLTGRKDLSFDAVNAFVEGNASSDEIQNVENLMQDNASLKKDLSTQQALRSVLGRIEKIEAPRSFVVTPEMVAASAAQDSLLSRVAELFVPQRRLALAPAAIAVITTVSVALLTIGDVTGIVDQSSSSRSESFSTAEISNLTAGGKASSTGVAGAPGNPGDPGSSADMFATEKASSSGAATAAPAATTAIAAVVPKFDSVDDSVAAEAADAPVAELADSSTGSEEPEPPSIMLEAPTNAMSPDTDDSDSTVFRSYDEDSSITQTQLESREFDTDVDVLAGDGSSSIEAEAELAHAQDTTFELVPSNNGISLPLWQLQVSLVALAISAIGAWAGLRRIRGE